MHMQVISPKKTFTDGPLKWGLDARTEDKHLTHLLEPKWYVGGLKP